MTRLRLFRVLIAVALASGPLLTIASGVAHAEGDGPGVIHMSAEACRTADVSVTAALIGSRTGVIEALGVVEPETSQVVHIHPAGSGKVLSVDVTPGARIATHQILLRYQDHSLHLVRLQLAKAKAALASAEAAQADARAAYARAQALQGASVSMGEMRRRAAMMFAAQDEVAARQADLDTLRHQLEEEYNSVTEADDRAEVSDDETSRVLAPVAGEVLAIGAGVAEDISPATEIATLADLSTVWLATDLTPEDASRVAPGGEEVTTVASSQPSLRGHVLSVGAVVDPATGLVRVLSRLPNENGALRPGMMLPTQISTRERATGIVVPSDAVVSMGGQSQVFTLEEEGASERVFRARPVRVSLDTGSEAVLSEGISAGQKVVTHGAFALKAASLMALGGEGGG